MLTLKLQFSKLIYQTIFQYVLYLQRKNVLISYGYNRVITDDATERFNDALYETDWVEIETYDNPSECYKSFFKNFLLLTKTFSKKEENTKDSRQLKPLNNKWN